MPLQLREMDLARDPDLEAQYPDGAWVRVLELDSGQAATFGEPDGAWLSVEHIILLGDTGMILVGVNFMESEVVYWTLCTDDDRLFVSNPR